eukprot:487359-Rhodomonas_salina.1
MPQYRPTGEKSQYRMSSSSCRCGNIRCSVVSARLTHTQQTAFRSELYADSGVGCALDCAERQLIAASAIAGAVPDAVLTGDVRQRCVP